MVAADTRSYTFFFVGKEFWAACTDRAVVDVELVFWVVVNFFVNFAGIGAIGTHEEVLCVASDEALFSFLCTFSF